MRFMSSVKRETIFYSDRTRTMREKKRKARIWKPELPKLTGSCRLLLSLASAVLAALSITQAAARILTQPAGIAVYALAAVLLTGSCLYLAQDIKSGVVLLTIVRDMAKRYPDVVVISIAAYTFYKIITAVIHMVRVRKLRSPLLTALRNIGAANALVSLLTLQTTMLASFSSEGSSLDANLMNAVTGFVVCVLVAALGISMIRFPWGSAQHVAGTGRETQNGIE